MHDWSNLVVDHSAALERFQRTAGKISADRWSQPCAPGKWSPAEITSHLVESYQVLRGELTGGPGMQLRLGVLRRWLFRHTVLPRILATGKFPVGARAPRETRPRGAGGSSTALLLALSEQADGFVQSLSQRTRAGRVRLTHAYFGSLSARQALRMVTVHTSHHADQLARVIETLVA